MDALTDAEIRASFVNCSKGEAKRISLPRDLSELPWGDLDFVGWRDPGAPDRAYLVSPVTGGDPVGLAMRVAPGARRNLMRSSLCGLCLTGHGGGGVDLLAAPLAGQAGRQGNTVALYMCADLACSLYIRGKKTTPLVRRMEETLTLDEHIARTRRNLDAFLVKVTASAA
ncbi:FBP domain-containing protein [Actinacidiphila bryophytorum]|uniref:FBP C-terminal treble-clef zinc-finger n=1 Tax=Actinacidiphila bryophytorum TaxID=1436133 RepID=A0A9W4MCH8_9ACTN|nr:FBP domain-containing protein [Actinacidiphila bryophytorum]MBM9440595.1 FBP domain-containing protein [Actinacidiphila bryophytorum]MBN6543178.1 FBP domain-containing protein [Actinacidiphila bryophytorum]CAG7645259.1 FBP C-terminal treble-clef zinc-finger [Actinacidiphila bryophytorum]